MFSSDLNRKVFIDPMEAGADHLCIISAYATPTMATWLMNLVKSLDKHIKLTLVVGMAGEQGIPTTDHESFKSLVRERPAENIESFECSYVYQGAPVHSKMYIWLSDDRPVYAFTGSANFTQTAFSNRQREVMTECDPNLAFDYFNSLIDDTIYCNHAEVEEVVTIIPPRDIVYENAEQVTLSFLTRRTNDVGSTSGLNWGQRDRRNPNEAYIPMPANIARSGFFPLDEAVFTVLTDDHRQLLLRVEQAGNKAITTPLSNALLGEYFRNRLGVAEGAKVTKADLERYGRTDVTFTKIEDELFYMDFSV